MEDKLSLLTQLIKLARIDDEVREDEYRFIMAIAEMLKVSEAEVDPLFDEYIQTPPPGSEFERILQFHRLVLMANVDLEVNSKELEFLRDCGLHLGLRPEAVEKVLREMKLHPHGAIPHQRMIAIFQAYHN